MTDVSLVFNVIGRDKGVASTLAKVKAEAIAASQDTAKSFKDIDAEIARVEASAKRLGAEFIRTGDTEVLKDLRKEHKTLAGLKQVRAEMANLTEESAHAAGFFGQIGEGLSAVGSKIGSVFSDNPYIASGIAAAIVVGAPVIGAAASSAVLLGIGGGALAAGIALAAKDSRVTSAWGEVASSAGEQLKKSALVFVAPLTQAAWTVQRAFNDIMPGIRGAFSTLAPVVDRMAAGVAGLLRNAMPGVEKAISASVPLLNTLADHLPVLGSAISQFFAAIARGGPGAQIFFEDVLGQVELLIVGLGSLIEWLSKAYAVMSIGVSLMSGDLAGAAAKMATFGQTGQTAGLQVASGLSDASKEAAKAKQSIDELNTELDRLLNQAISSQQANLAFKQALDDLTTAAQENGNTLDINSQKGRANQQAILAAADAAVRNRDAIFAQTGSIDQANAAFGQNMDALYAAAAAAGYNKRQVDAMLASIRNLPNDTQLNIDLRNAGATQDDIREINRGLNTIPRYIPVTVEVYQKGSYGGIGGLGFKGFASGGTPPVGEPFWVGERGPELMWGDKPSYVMPHDESMTLASRTGHGAASPIRATAGGLSLTIGSITISNPAPGYAARAADDLLEAIGSRLRDNPHVMSEWMRRGGR